MGRYLQKSLDQLRTPQAGDGEACCCRQCCHSGLSVFVSEFLNEEGSRLMRASIAWTRAPSILLRPTCCLDQFRPSKEHATCEAAHDGPLVPQVNRNLSQYLGTVVVALLVCCSKGLFVLCGRLVVVLRMFAQARERFLKAGAFRCTNRPLHLINGCWR